MPTTYSEEELRQSLQRAQQLQDGGDVVAARSAYQEIVAMSCSETGSLQHRIAAWAAFGLLTWDDGEKCDERLGRLLIDYARKADDLEIVEAAAFVALTFGRPFDQQQADGAQHWLRAAEELGQRAGSARGIQLAFAAFHGLAGTEIDPAKALFYRTQLLNFAHRSRDVSAIESAAMACYLHAHSLQHQTWAYRWALYLTFMTSLRMKNADGLQTAAVAAFDLALDFKRSRWPRLARWLLVAALKWGAASQTAYGLEQAAKASFRLGADHAGGRRALDFYGFAIELGRASGTSRALEYAAAAACNLAALVGGRDLVRVRSLYEEAMQLGAQSATGNARCHATLAAERLAETQRLLELVAQAPLRTKGVVVIHGVGHPEKGRTCRNITVAIQQWLTGNAPVNGALLCPQIETEMSSDGRSFATLRHGSESWIFTEAHWSASINSPAFGATLRWAVAHFARYSLRLARDAVMKNFVPTVRGVLEVAVWVAYAVALLPIAVVALPVLPALTVLLRAVMDATYVAVIGRLREFSNPSERQAAIDAAVRLWRKLSVNGIGCVTFLIGVVIVAGLWWMDVVILGGWTECAVVLYIVVFVPLWVRTIAKFAAKDPLIDGTPVTISGASMTLSRDTAQSARLEVQSFSQIYRNGFRELATAPAAAALNGLSRWLLVNSEFMLLRHAQWGNFSDSTAGRVGVSVAMICLILFRLMNGVVAIALYTLGTILIFPVAMVVWGISASGTSAARSQTIVRMKSVLDRLILGSIGDIYLFVHDEEQAAIIRDELLNSIAAITERCDDVCVIAHSMGCAISYETLSDPRNAEAVRSVRTLVTVGGILPMVWRMPGLRPAFDAPLPSHMRWINLWARLDPAEGGPLPPRRMTFASTDLAAAREAATSGFLSFGPAHDPAPGVHQEVAVSNEDDVWRDHTTYWRNGQEVIPCLVRQIWGEEASEATGNFERLEARRAFRQRLRILCTSGPRMLAWYVFPVVTCYAWVSSAISLLGSILLGAVATAAAHLAVWAFRKTLWDLYLRRLDIFSESIPPPPRPVVDMGDQSGTVLGIGPARPLFM